MILDKAYNRDEFLVFIKELIPDFKKDIRKVSNASLKVTDEIQLLGESENLELPIFEIIHSSSNNARIALATDGFRAMKNSANYQALVVYKTEDTANWRLSLLTTTPKITDKGTVGFDFSNPRRFSFFLGPDAKVNTPYQLLIKQGAIEDLEDLKSRFSLEVVNKEFYKQISLKFTELIGGTLGKGKNKTTYKALLKLPSIEDHSQTSIEFAVRLIGRILFCWFLREKKSENGKSLMPIELLSIDAVTSSRDYYHNVLEPIFFQVLNKRIRSRKDPFNIEPYSLIPYLNGGLFSPHSDDFFSYSERKQAVNYNTVLVPDEWLKEFFKILETYNFTIDENTSFDEELSIDPEMLGRIFENLLAEINPETGESIRKSTGSYYTPRLIVDYMVDESLVLYLKEKTNVTEKKLRAVVSYDLTDDVTHPLDKSDKNEITNALESLKLLDPACGSGAYPIGALQKMVFVLQQIDPDGQMWFKKQIKSTSPEIRRVLEREFKNKNFDYIRKLGIIRENIYGVDIQPIATEISRLRCFLTLVVDQFVIDEEENRGIEPLPNLDFKFVTANTLIELPKRDEKKQGLFDDYESIDELKDLRDQYFNASDLEREQLKTEFATQQTRIFKNLQQEHSWAGVVKAELTNKLTDWEPFTHKSTSWFDPEWMFGIKEGFDIVIGNPPYGLLNKKQNQKMGHKVTKQDLKYYKEYPLFAPAKGGMINVFRLFICKSVDLLNNSGNFSLIFPIGFMGDLSSSKLRKYLLKNSSICYLEAFPERDDANKRVFEAVKMSVCILGVSKTPPESKDYHFPVRLNPENYIDLSLKPALFSPSIIKKIDPTNYSIPQVNPDELLLLSKINENSVRLNKIGRCYTGEIDLTLNKDLITSNPKDAPLIKGAQVQRYDLLDTMSQGEIVYLVKNSYIKSITGSRSKHYLKQRIVMQGITGVNENTRLKMTLIDSEIFCANSVNYFIPHGNEDIHFLLGLLNSKVMNWCFNVMSTNSNVNGYEIDNLPYRTTISEENKADISNIARQIIASSDPTSKNNLIQKLDEQIFKIYGINEKEVSLLSG